MNLGPFDAKRVALVLHHLDWRRVVRGLATYEQDPVYGAVLRITAPEDSDNPGFEPEFIFQEETWDGIITPDNQFGCDYTVELSV